MTERFPQSIQQLFAAKPPLLYVAPADYPPQQRRSMAVAPVAPLKHRYQAHLDHLKATTTTPTPIAASPPAVPSTQDTGASTRKSHHQQSFKRQLEEWHAYAHADDDVGDPHRTVFVLRLDYHVTELDLSKALANYGVIESVKIIRNRTDNTSRGYGFVVFERDTDAATCVLELLRLGIRLGSRTALVDFERGHTQRNWLPRRLGGGLGGRGQAAKGQFASAAATQRRHPTSRGFSQLYLLRSFTAPPRAPRPKDTARDPSREYAPPPRQDTRSVRDKYANYLSMKY